MQLKDTGERLIVKEGAENDPNYLRHMAAYRFAGRFVKEKIVLDSGCGSGYGAHYLAINGANKVTGVDQSEEAITYARSRYRCANLEFEIGGVGNLTYPDETFDVVTSFQVIEHLKEPERLLKETQRVLKKCGIAFISTPNKQTYSPGTIQPQNPFHIREFYFDEFKSLLSAYFNQVEILGVNQSNKVDHLAKQKNQSLYIRLERLAHRIRALSIINNIIPKQLKRFLTPTIKGLDISDFCVDRLNPEVSLDFMAVCKKI
jgi:ubiquinone/menaquinone biosynthesis C-methylase UbiE